MPQAQSPANPRDRTRAQMITRSGCGCKPNRHRRSSKALGRDRASRHAPWLLTGARSRRSGAVAWLRSTVFRVVVLVALGSHFRGKDSRSGTLDPPDHPCDADHNDPEIETHLRGDRGTDRVGCGLMPPVPAVVRIRTVK